MPRLSFFLFAAATLAALSLRTLVAVPATTQPAKPATPEVKDTVVVDVDTEKLIRGALKYLATQQSPNGSWASRGGEHPVAMTGYTIMTFLASGQLPGEGEYGKSVTNGVNYLLGCVREDGYITSEGLKTGRKSSNMYDHGIASIALGEVYGQTQDPKIKEKLELSVKLIVSAQNREGGWRYGPHPGDADISVTVLQVVALRAAKNAGLAVPQKTIDSAITYVKSCYDQRSGGFTYQPRNNQPGFARTAAATYSLQVCGLYDDDLVKAGSKYLLKEGRPEGEWYTYGNFYAAPAQYMVGGKTWSDWYARIKRELVPKAKREGELTFWEPMDNNRDLGPLYSTAVYTNILSMPYHYVPLYQR
jgi:squalene cyclase